MLVVIIMMMVMMTTPTISMIILGAYASWIRHIYIQYMAVDQIYLRIITRYIYIYVYIDVYYGKYWIKRCLLQHKCIPTVFSAMVTCFVHHPSLSTRQFAGDSLNEGRIRAGGTRSTSINIGATNHRSIRSHAVNHMSYWTIMQL